MAQKATKNLKEKAVLKALDLAEERGWAGLTLADIATACKVKPAALYDYFEDKNDILAAFGRMIDKQALEAASAPDDSLSPRDRLFDLLMERFEALNSYRNGLVSVIEYFRCDPKQAVLTFPHLCRSMAWMLEASGISTDGVIGALKVAGLCGIYLKTLYVWKDDVSTDLSKTMAALDRALGRAESLAQKFDF